MTNGEGGVQQEANRAKIVLDCKAITRGKSKRAFISQFELCVFLMPEKIYAKNEGYVGL